LAFSEARSAGEAAAGPVAATRPACERDGAPFWIARQFRSIDG
jgi:hypothetical protein